LPHIRRAIAARELRYSTPGNLGIVRFLAVLVLLAACSGQLPGGNPRGERGLGGLPDDGGAGGEGPYPYLPEPGNGGWQPGCTIEDARSLRFRGCELPDLYNRIVPGSVTHLPAGIVVPGEPCQALVFTENSCGMLMSVFLPQASKGTRITLDVDGSRVLCNPRDLLCVAPIGTLSAVDVCTNVNGTCSCRHYQALRDTAPGGGWGVWLGDPGRATACP
jgi:hypothetical protein